MTQQIDLVDGIMRYESGEMSEEEIVSFFQHLIDTGTAWTLQGHYGRTAARLIEAGYCTRPAKGVDKNGKDVR